MALCKDQTLLPEHLVDIVRGGGEAEIELNALTALVKVNLNTTLMTLTCTTVLQTEHLPICTDYSWGRTYSILSLY